MSRIDSSTRLAAIAESNWPPAPDEPIYLVMRLYWPKTKPPSILSVDKRTWKPPAVERVAQLDDRLFFGDGFLALCFFGELLEFVLLGSHEARRDDKLGAVVDGHVEQDHVFRGHE